MEPNKEIHYDPVSVLDYQSLYPSVIISHNICYTTCLGWIKKEQGKFGVYKVTKSIQEYFGYPKDHILGE